MSDINTEPAQMLLEMVEQAMQQGADSIEIEVERDNVEVCFMIGNEGAGPVLNLNRGQRLISFILQEAHMQGGDGKLTIQRKGKACTIPVSAFHTGVGIECHLKLPRT